MDACSAHSERKIWSEKKCSILKSDVFALCHSEVDVDKFMKRCIFDSCACDQGGDCECLCTAVAAYAHACTMKGVPIRWRTPDFCRTFSFTYFYLPFYSNSEIKNEISVFSDAM